MAYLGGNIKWNPPEHRKDVVYAQFSPEDLSTRYIGRDDRSWVNIKWRDDSDLLLVEDLEFGLFRGEKFDCPESCVLLPLDFTSFLSRMDRLISSGVLGTYHAPGCGELPPLTWSLFVPLARSQACRTAQNPPAPDAGALADP